jgi:hypothetical protein
MKGEIIPEKSFYYAGEPISLKIVLKNIGEKKWRIHPPAILNGNIGIIIYHEGKWVKYRAPVHVISEVHLSSKVEVWEGYANIILQPGDSFITYFHLSTLWGANYIYRTGKYLLEKIIYTLPSHDEPPSLSIPVWMETITLSMNKEIIVKKPEGKLLEIRKKWLEAREKAYFSKEMDFSYYLEVLKICPDTIPYFPNILSECLGRIEPKRYWLKKFLNTYLYHPFVGGFINDYEWCKKMILPYGKEFIDSLPDKVKNEIYKTMEGKW